MGLDSLYCGKWRKNLKSLSNLDLDLDLTIPNIEIHRDIYIYNNVFKFLVPRYVTFLVIMQKHTHMHTHTHTHQDAHTHTNSDEYSIVGKNATITI